LYCVTLISKECVGIFIRCLESITPAIKNIYLGCKLE
jgi:hypothetical protein